MVLPIPGALCWLNVVIVSLKGDEYQYLFDSGAAQNLLSRQLVEMLGVKFKST